MQTIELSWISPKKINIFKRVWKPDTDTKAVVVLVHGIGEHIDRYAHVARMYTDHQFAFIGSDLVGHGKSGGQRGHVDSFNDFFDQIDGMLDVAERNFPKLPVFLYGHSLGANIVLRYLETDHRPIAGAIVTSPALEVTRIPPLKLAVGKLMYNAYPRFSMTNSLDTSGLSHNPQVVEDYIHDPLVHPMISARLGLDLINSSQLIFNDREKIDVPLLLMHGSQDRLVNVAGSREFARQFRGNFKYIEYAEGYHELHNETFQQQVFASWLEWLNQILNQG